MTKFNQSRRSFLKHSGCAGVAASTLFSGLAQLGAVTAASAQPLSSGSDYKALVCVLLAGGADSFNMLVPVDNTGYQQYATSRSDLALKQSELLSLNNGVSGQRQLAVHPAMQPLQNLFNQGQLAFLSNVGTLVEPTSIEALRNNTARFPLGLHSHSDQISQWQTAIPDNRSATGWGGRLADVLRSLNSNQKISMSISTAGTNEFQAGKFTDSFSISGDEGTSQLYDYAHPESEFDRLRYQALDKMYENQYSNIFRRAYLDTFKSSLSANAEFKQALNTAPAFSTQFAADNFSQQLQKVAKAIAANKTLGMQRQTFFVQFGGWDHHDDTLRNMRQMLPALSQGLAAFQATMQELGMTNNVTTFTTSDFGRTLSSNGKGSDHAWGGNHMIMGGAVKGGKIYGDYPSLSLSDNPLDTGRGVIMPTTSVDVYFAELALWMGVSPGQLADILPNIGRFYAANSKQAPVGFMG